jgi:hypothetical protein
MLTEGLPFIHDRCSNVTENRVHIYASSYGTKIISPYAAPDS